jgi:hypothetical protein
MCKLPVNVCVRVIGWVTETVVSYDDITACFADSPTAVTDLSVKLLTFSSHILRIFEYILFES